MSYLVMPEQYGNVSEFVGVFDFSDLTSADLPSVLALLYDKRYSRTFDLGLKGRSSYGFSRRRETLFKKVFEVTHRGNIFDRSINEYTISESVWRGYWQWYYAERPKRLACFEYKPKISIGFKFGRQFFKSKAALMKEKRLTRREVDKMGLDESRFLELVSAPFEHSKHQEERKYQYFTAPKYNKEAVAQFADWFDETLNIHALTENVGKAELAALGVWDFNNDINDRRAYYYRHDFGRLFTVKPRGMSKLWRSVVFSGFYEYDIETAAPNILVQFAERNGSGGKGWKNIRKYIADKEGYRKELSQLLELSEEGGKNLLNALFFGAVVPSKQNDLKDSAVGELISKYSIEKQSVHEYFKRIFVATKTTKFGGLFREIGRLFAEISKIVKNKSTYTHFIFDSIQIPRDRIKNRSVLVSALYQHEEAKVLAAMTNNISSELLIHDAFISSSDYPVEILENMIKQETGYDLTIKKVQLFDILTEKLKKYQKISDI